MNCLCTKTEINCRQGRDCPVVYNEPPFPGDAASWTAYAVIVLLFTLVVFLPLYFNAL